MANNNQDNPAFKDAYHKLKRFWTTAPGTAGEVAIPPLEYLEKIARFVSPGEFFFYVFNLRTAQIELVSPMVEDILGIPQEELNINRLLGSVHPEHLEAIQQKEFISNNFFTTKIPAHLMNKYKLIYTYKVVTGRGETLNLMHQSMPIHENEDGNYLYTLNIDMDISDWNIPVTNKISFISRDGSNRSYYNVDAFNPDLENADEEDKLFSNRELEVLDAVARGVNNQEIAKELGISVHTIDTYRKKILAKSGQRNLTQLIANCVRQGII